MSAMKIINRESEIVPVDRLSRHPRNPRRGNVDLIRESIDANGFYGAIVAQRSTGHILVGNHRYDAARAEGASEVPVIWLDVDDDRARRILLADNRTNDLAGYDEQELARLLAEIQAETDSLVGTGYDADALEALLAGLPSDGAANDDDAAAELADRTEELREKWGTERGQLWQVGRHRLMCGDGTSRSDIEPLLDTNAVDLVVTSPPYNQGIDRFQSSGMHKESHWVRNVQAGAYADSRPESAYQDEQIAALRLWSEFLAPTASLFYNHKNRYRDKRVVSPLSWIARSGAKVRQEIIWRRPGSVTQNARMFLPCDERIYWLYFGDDFFFSDITEIKSWSSVWDIAPHLDVNGSDHACAFPVELAERPIRACTKHTGHVFDPFVGSGTTIVATENLGRTCYAMDIDAAYVAVTLERLTAKGLEARCLS